MKTIQLATGLLFAATLFTACKKDRYDITTSQAIGAQTKTTLPANALVKFNSGSIMTRSILVTGGGRTLMEARDIQKLDLYAPVNQSTLKQIVQGGYDNFRITMEGFQNSGAPALYLHGSHTMGNGSVIPVSFMINSVVRLTSNAQVMNVGESTTLLNLLNIESDYLTANITQDEWDQAYKETMNLSNGEILVSERYNVALYKRILENMQTMLHVSFSASPTPDPTTDPTTADAVTDNGVVQ